MFTGNVLFKNVILYNVIEMIFLFYYVYIVSTFLHELFHGIAAVMVGGKLLEIYFGPFVMERNGNRFKLSILKQLFVN